MTNTDTRRCETCIRLEPFMRRGFMVWCVAWGMYRNPKSKPLIPQGESGHCWKEQPHD